MFCEYRFTYSKAEVFMADEVRRRMDKVMLYFYQKGGKENPTFQKWRLKYLEYVKTNHPTLYNKTQ